MTDNINTSKPRSLSLFSKFIIITTILLVILGPLGLVEFLIGLLSPLRSPLFTLITPFFIYAASLFFMLITVFASFFWKKYIKNKIYGWLMPFGVIFLFVVVFLIAPSPYLAFLHGFKLRVERLADASEIRNWLGSVEEWELNGEMFYMDPNWVEVQILQPSFKNFAFGRLVLDKDENGEPILSVVYSGCFNDWGFVIGDPNMDIETAYPWIERYYTLPVEPGVYVWYGYFDQWGNDGKFQGD
ncbi:MAG: hypothetical protein JSV99_07670 [Planctomycetota bacterium]|nr:MAG: hypothetical protein JSV99_07670 [Planctomycetota bacterium]